MDSGDRTANSPRQHAISPVQCAAIKQIVTVSITNALATLHVYITPYSRPSHNYPTSLCKPFPASKPQLGIQTLHGIYVQQPCVVLVVVTREFIPDPDPRSSADLGQFSPRSHGVLMVPKRKSVLDTFHKWLDAFTAYMLLLIMAYPWRALELIKYQQVVSQVMSKFKGMV